MALYPPEKQTKKKRGRPRKKKAGNKKPESVNVFFRLPAAEIDLLKAAAQERGNNVSEFLRHLWERWKADNQAAASEALASTQEKTEAQPQVNDENSSTGDDEPPALPGGNKETSSDDA